jgi:hypothetical protein
MTTGTGYALGTMNIVLEQFNRLPSQTLVASVTLILRCCSTDECAQRKHDDDQQGG